jgi:hypothetical protein
MANLQGGLLVPGLVGSRKDVLCNAEHTVGFAYLPRTINERRTKQARRRENDRENTHTEREGQEERETERERDRERER